MSLIMALPSFWRLELVLFLGHCQLFSCSNWTTRKAVEIKGEEQRKTRKKNEINYFAKEICVVFPWKPVTLVVCALKGTAAAIAQIHLFFNP